MSEEGPIRRLYLDTCVYNRLFDDQSQPRIWLETLAFSVIVQMIEDKTVVLVASSVVSYENSVSSDAVARNWVTRCTALACENQFVDVRIRERAEELEREGFKALDALHLACAEAAGCDYFVTCDDRLMKRYRRRRRALKICNPVEFVEAESGG